MKEGIKFLFLSLIFIACQEQQENSTTTKNYASIVNPFIGTGGHGHTYPGASAPFGFVQLSPDTRLDGWDGCGGYHYSDSVIYGFSHTHLSGTGVSDYGDILLMPMNHIEFENAYGHHPDSGYGMLFNHDSEKAEAGYYEVKLDNGTKVKLTATERCGFQEYSYSKENELRYVLLDLLHRDSLLDGKIEVLNDSTVRGKRISRAWAVEQHVYYFIKFSQPIVESVYNSDSSKVIFKFKDQLLKTKLGLSAVSMDGAEANLNQEIPHWNFEQTKQETQQLWNQELAKIQVEMPHDSDQVIFYTALYHSFLNPNIFQDVDQFYRGTDLDIHQTNGEFNNYTIFSLWDTYRATHPLFTLVQEKRTEDFIHTFLNQYKNGGKLPVWELAGNYTGCMIGYHSIPVIADAYVKGITDFDTKLALEAMLATANANELGKHEFANNGYAAMDEEHESVSKNLEYAYDDWCIAQFAKAISRDDVYAEFIQRAQHYKNSFDPETKFMRAKRNQQFTEPFNPTEVNFNFTEANSWQYSFYVPQDIKGLIDLYGGNDGFEQKLDSLFTTSNKTSGRHQVDITGLVGQYAHGNEPSHHMGYLYNYVGKPHKTQSRIRSLMKEMYANKPDGLIGNEDCGQMSSWYVFSALGFYPVTPGSSDYIIGSPLVSAAKIQLENGNYFEIETKNNSDKNVFIKSISLNGQEYNKSYINHYDILKGGKMVFTMSNTPNEKYLLEQPKSEIEDIKIVPVPYIVAKDQVFKDSLLIELASVDQTSDIFYSINDKEFAEYSKSISIKSTTDIKIKATSQDGSNESQIGEAHFYQMNHNRTVNYNYEYNLQYSAGGKKGLVDLIRGGSDFRTGSWQGFQGKDIEIIVKLETPEIISHISSGYIQDINSWIWMPQTVRYSYSIDGNTYTEIESIPNTIPTDQYGVFLKDFESNFNPLKAQYIKLEASQFGTIPNWHLGKGGESFIFIDEIIIR